MLHTELKSVLSINDLPSEVLGAIFEAGKPDKPLSYNVPYELNISQVSSHWRANAHSTSSLWTQIHISSSRRLDVVSQYLKRSAGRPIHIHIDIYREDRKMKGLMADHIMDVVAPYINRCQSLFVLVNHQKTAGRFIARLVDLEAPLLEILRINLNYSLWGTSVHLPGAEVGFFDNFFTGGSPRLRFLETEVPYSLPPLSNVITLHLHGLVYQSPLSYERLCDIAASAPFLENLSIRGILSLTSWPDDFGLAALNRELHMNALRSLLVAYAPLAAKMLLAISAPNLRSLWLDCSEVISLQRLCNYPQISQTNKFPSLEYLTLHRVSGWEIKSVAMAFPTVQCLHLSYPRIHQWVHLEDMLTVGYGGVAWRKLSTIVVRTVCDPEEHSSRLLQCLHSIIAYRRYKVVPISRLLADSGAYRSLLKHSNGELAEQIELSVVNNRNYQDHWWLSSHVDPLDDV